MYEAITKYDSGGRIDYEQCEVSKPLSANCRINIIVYIMI